MSTTIENALSIFSDVYKEAYGVRPRGVDLSALSLSEIESEIEHLSEVAHARVEVEREAEAVAVAQFEAHVADVIATGAGCREAALRWIHEAEETEGDWERLAWALGLPFGYFTVAS